MIISRHLTANMPMLRQLGLTTPKTYSTHAIGSAAKEDFERAKPFDEIPGPKGLPYFGTLLQYRFGRFRPHLYHKALIERYKKYGKIFKETINGETSVHLFDPDYSRTIYQNEGRSPEIVPLLQTIQMYRKYRDMSPGLGNTNGEEWYRLRTAVQKVILTPKSVATFLPYVNHVTDDLILRMTQIRDPISGQIANFDNEIAKWNIESCGMSCFERRIGCLEIEDDTSSSSSSSSSWQQRIINANSAIFELSSRMTFSIPFHRLFTTPTWKKLLQSEDFFYSQTLSLVDEAVKQLKDLIDRGQHSPDRFALLTYLLNRKELSVSDIKVIVLSIFSDGLSTTTPSILGLLHCIATNPEKQEMLHSELELLLPEPETPITDDVIQRASYLKACIKEGFRLFPINLEISRISPKDIVIGGYQIPAGTDVRLNTSLLLRSSEYFDNPNDYVPERWTRGGSAQAVHPYLHLPFGHGPRTCAGMRLAEQEIRVFVMKVLRKFRIIWRNEEKSDEEIGQRFAMLLKPDFRPSFQFIPRN